VTASRRALVAVALVAFTAFGALMTARTPLKSPPGADTLPARLSDAEFWVLVGEVSEPGGTFQNDNYTSNEPEVGVLSTMLRDTGVKGGVYLGVGPEQNFSYIAAIRPAMAFVIDIRRQAVMQHLMFKAVFEMAANRAEFIAALFGKPRPADLDAATPIQTMWEAFSRVATDRAASGRTYARIVERLTTRHGFTLTADESVQLESVFGAFQAYGPSITTRGPHDGGSNARWTFADLTGGMTDHQGVPQSFLSTEDNYLAVKALQEKNLIVSVSGDFGGPKTIRAIGAYVRARHATVSAFYLSNVEQYLFFSKVTAFIDNVATLPLTPASVFIRPYSLRGLWPRPLCAILPYLQAFAAGRIHNNDQALACGQ
jgi:hypothetical protein